MNIKQRIHLLSTLGEYLGGNDTKWLDVSKKAQADNGWFVPEYIDRSVQNIRRAFLDHSKLEAWAESYALPEEKANPRTVGIVMAGNIPLVGFHDMLCCFISGNRSLIKTSSKDDALIKHLVEVLSQWDESVKALIGFSDRLNGCDAYIATGSNNTSRYFEYYFSKYPHIIRRNRTSVAVLQGNETGTELNALADDIMLYFGLGCRNVTQIYVPKDYDFIALLAALNNYGWASDHNKYRSNYDYNLALHMLNGTYYMTNESILLIEHPAPFSPISQLHYQFYDKGEPLVAGLKSSEDIQAIIGHFGIPFGQAQKPKLNDYADGIDTMAWLKLLN